MKRLTWGVLGLATLALTSGCYWNEKVESNQVGLKLKGGTTIDEIVGAGRYSSAGWYDDIKVIDVSAKTISWNDPDLVTRDLQPIGLTLQITYARNSDADMIELMWNRYRSQATSDESLQVMVEGRVPAVAKEITARYSLSELIGTTGSDQAGRSVVAKSLSDLLTPQLDEFGVQLLDVGVTNIDPGQAYLDLLSQKAQVDLQKDIAVQKTKQLEEQLNQEIAETNIAKERANRDRESEQIRNQVYQDNPAALELERARIWAEALQNAGATVYFVPEGTDLTTVMGGGNVVPVPNPNPTASSTPSP